MGFNFTFLCDLLSSLEDNRILKAATQARTRNPDVRVVTQWFARHDKRLRDPETNQLALISCMLPEKRTDRVYWLQDTSLARVIGRCLLLGTSRLAELGKWRTCGGADLGQCVENVLRQAENHVLSGQEVTVEEIDNALTLIASRCRFSGPNVRRQRSAVDVEETLSPLYRRLSSRDAKWLTRMILKTHFSNLLPEKLTLKNFHFLLPHLLLFQNSFEAALTLLSSEPISHFPPRPEPGLMKDLGKIALYHLVPGVGIKVGRPDYYKGRSIKHCCKMIGQKRMSVERKYDGEYCQIHIDLSRHPNSIQIFSKSGKDSTKDRAGIHQAVKDALQIDTLGCKFSTRCILEGELLVWNDKHQDIMQFHKLRKFISRSGSFIGTENDSPPQSCEHLMIVFFDVLLLDDDICLRKPHRERRLLLKDIIHIIPGLAEIAEQRVIDFSQSDGQSRLETFFYMGIAERWEGLILKGCEDPYFPILINPDDNCFGRWIKLKKDYIPGLGDTIDLALIGAAYNSRDASSLGLVKKESWTHFFVGCLMNQNDVLHSNADPKFRVVDVIDHHCMSQPTMQILNKFGKYGARSPDPDQRDIEYGRSNLPRMDVVFKIPFIVEMLGSGFEKPSGARYYTLRFPRILKVHPDRSLEDAASFQELQSLAEAAVSVPSADLAEEEAEWANRVKSSTSMRGYIPDDSQSSSIVSPSTPSKETVIKKIGAQDLDSSQPGALEKTSYTNPRSLARQRNGVSESANDFPIYIDDLTSTSSGRQGKAEGNILANNGNLSSQGNARKRKVSPLEPEFRNEGALSGLSKRIQALNEKDNSTSVAVSSTLPGTSDAEPSGNNGQTPDGKNEFDVESPFSILPLYMSSEIYSDYNTGKSIRFTNVSHTLNEFLLMLNSENKSLISTAHDPKSGSEKLVMGILFTDGSQTPLHTTLLELSRQVSQSLRAPTGTSNLYPRGRIFLLNSKLLRLGMNLNHAKFSLRKTWDKVSQKYFYACLTWELEMTPLAVVIDEIPGTPMDDQNKHQTQAQVHVSAINMAFKKNGRPIPKLRISFDRKEILILGGFSSLDPRVRVAD
ncbi:hypothetical protein BJX99DRAFT_269752 [Aspergillus californicus]